MPHQVPSRLAGTNSQSVASSAMACGAAGCDIDLVGLEFIDSTGMSLFVYVYDAAKAEALDIRMLNVKGSVREALCRAGFDTLFPLG